MTDSAETLERALEAHARVVGDPPLAIHCACGWSAPDRFIANPGLHRAHVAQALIDSGAVTPLADAVDALAKDETTVEAVHALCAGSQEPSAFIRALAAVVRDGAA